MFFNLLLASRSGLLLLLFSRSIVSKSCDPHGLWPISLLCPWDFPGKDTGVGCHFLLQGIFPTPGIEPLSPALADTYFTTEPPRKAHPGLNRICRTQPYLGSSHLRALSQSLTPGQAIPHCPQSPLCPEPLNATSSSPHPPREPLAWCSVLLQEPWLTPA